MMFDPPDFPYKELTDTLRDNYDPDDLFNCVTNDTTASSLTTNTDNDLAEMAEHMISTVEKQLIFNSNDCDSYFNVGNASILDISSSNGEQNAELYIVQSDLFNFEPTLLDENTVNQFLLPLQVSTDAKTTESNGPDLLALQSCVICHEIFTTEADLLDHTISVHASSYTTLNPNEDSSLPINNKGGTDTAEDASNGKSSEFECDWLVCGVCQRVLSTALEVEPAEQICCNDASGKGSVMSRRLHTMYVCEYCNGLFANGEALDRHALACYIQDERNYYVDQTDPSNIDRSEARVPEICFTCDICSKQFLAADQLKTHAITCPRQTRRDRRAYCTNPSNKMWNCGSCNQLFSTARELYKHKRGEDRPAGAPPPAYVCEQCDKVLGSVCALHTHKKMHKVTKPGYPCRVCGRRFNQSGHLAIHMRMHTGERPYPCDLCSKAFKVKVERDDHRRTHTGERPFACPACPKTFTAAARLREHARIHTDQRPYRCEICGAAFRRPYARTVHTLIHTGEKPHECDVCGTAFRRSGDMWKHKRTLHGVQGVGGDTDIKNL